MHGALLEFDDLGVLRATQIPAKLSWVGEKHIDVLVKVLMSGEEGLPRRRTRKFDAAGADALRELELRDYVHWQRNRQGRLAFLCLTWKGEEAVRFILKVAHHGQHAASSAPKESAACCS